MAAILSAILVFVGLVVLALSRGPVLAGVGLLIIILGAGLLVRSRRRGAGP